ncbi:unnamed protein product [Durusdinium trenchii]|uniref:Uncharacterized protein n=1 Tax=Durusdinium trenchii TaxID=1381693 RepID=A0ABP0QV72_9DINO
MRWPTTARSQRPMEDATGGLTLQELDWPNLHGFSCGASGVLFLFELVRFCLGQPPSDIECYAAALIYSVVYATRFDGIRNLAPHFRDRFRPYYVPGLVGLMYFHWLDTVDMLNQWLDPRYWEHVVVDLPDQAWTIADVRLTGLFMSSMALFMITLHNKGVLTGGKNTLITVLFTIFVPALFLTGTHATLQACGPGSGSGMCHKGCTFSC